ncbi:MAG: DNA/RNA non-specific endonuclease [Cyclobacteriaceae bacterium]
MPRTWKTPENWKGYNPEFLHGFQIPFPNFDQWKDDLAINIDTGHFELPFIAFSSLQSISRRVPLLTAANLYRERMISIGRSGAFSADGRIKETEQLSTSIYKAVNSIQKESEHKLAKGHMVRREDVQWDPLHDEELAATAAAATFHYTNASPQHQAINNGVWKALENSVLIRGRSKEPKKAIVFTGPVLANNDPWLKIPESRVKVKCPLRFWKVIYFVNKADTLCYAAFLMSHKVEVEEDGYVKPDHSFIAVTESLKKEKPFLEFDERQTYQVGISLIEELTRLEFQPAHQALPEGGHQLLSLPGDRSLMLLEESAQYLQLVEGLVL